MIPDHDFRNFRFQKCNFKTSQKGHFFGDLGKVVRIFEKILRKMSSVSKNRKKCVLALKGVGLLMNARSESELRLSVIRNS